MSFSLYSRRKIIIEKSNHEHFKACVTIKEIELFLGFAEKRDSTSKST